MYVGTVISRMKLECKFLGGLGRGVDKTELDVYHVEEDLLCSVEECRLDSMSKGNSREDTWLGLSFYRMTKGCDPMFHFL